MSCGNRGHAGPRNHPPRALAKPRKIQAQPGAHYVNDSLIELPAVIEDINARLARGENP
ncbi:MAG: hypothetical protein L3J36_13470 [Rhodobacteraceae bacterium]|nr:hypothetical protein [Paracoccaceae bacterium]